MSAQIIDLASRQPAVDTMREAMSVLDALEAALVIIGHPMSPLAVVALEKALEELGYAIIRA